MAKRSYGQPITNVQPTKLTTDKEKFKSQLQDRIKIGEEILSRPINTQADLDKSEQDYHSWDDFNVELLKHAFNKENNEYKDSYASVNNALLYSLGGPSSKAEEVREHQECIRKKINNLNQLIAKTELLKVDDDVAIAVASPKSNNSDFTSVFIVHGHDDLAKTETARFIEKLGFKTIILHEQASSGKTIIEKIESYSNVGFGIVLYTPCDVGAVKGSENNLQSRARQNVVFEHGFLIGKIGRENVCALVKGKIETPNDISGVVYVAMDDHRGWQLTLARELKNSGYPVDLNKI